MNSNHLLIWMVGIASCATFIASYVTRQRTWLLASLIIIVAMTGAVLLLPDYAGFVGTGLWLLLIAFPQWTLRRLSVQMLRQEYSRARRTSKRLEYLLPLHRWGDQTRFIEGLERAQAGELEKAESIFEDLCSEKSALSETARLQRLRLAHEWSVIAEELERGDASRIDLNSAALYLRALGETRRVESLVDAYSVLWSRIEDAYVPEILRHTCRMILFAFTGDTASVRAILGESLRHYPREITEFWTATAEHAAGRVDSARRTFERLATSSDALARSAAQYRLESPPTSHVDSILGADQVGVLERVRARFSEEQRYGLPSTRARQRARGTKTLLVANVVLYALEIALGGSTDNEVLFRLGALHPEAVFDGEYWRLISAAFLHAGPLHIVGNMLALYLLGPFVELSLGRTRFFVFYFATILASMGFCLWYMHTVADSPSLLVGASGAIMGLVGASAVLLRRGWKEERSRIARRRLVLFAIVIVLQLTFDYVTPQVSIQAHASGLVFGVLAALFFVRFSRRTSTPDSRDSAR